MLYLLLFHSNYGCKDAPQCNVIFTFYVLFKTRFSIPRHFDDHLRLLQKTFGTHQLLLYADEVNVLGESIHTMKKSKEILLVAIKETCLVVNADKTKYMLMP